MKMVEFIVLEKLVLGDRFFNGFTVKMANRVFDPCGRLNNMMGHDSGHGAVTLVSAESGKGKTILAESVRCKTGLSKSGKGKTPGVKLPFL